MDESKELLAMINYQEDAVVSRTLIDKKTGTVTLFAFDKDQGLSEHTAPFDAFLNVLEGEAEVVIDRKQYKVGGGEMIILPAGKIHAVKAATRFKMLLAMIKS